MRDKVNTLLIYKIITSSLEEAALVAAVLWGLPLVDINLPVWVLVPATIVLQAWNVFSYRKSIQALKSKPVTGLASMVGSQGEAVNHLAPDGMVKIMGELWAATAADGRIVTGRKVTVVGQNGLRLVVRESE